MKLSVLIIQAAFLLFSNNAFSKDVHFVIPEGTSENELDWNSQDNPVLAEVGDTLIITNEDSEPARLHTDGRPCPHGEVMEPGESWSCLLTKTYNALEEANPTRDHWSYAAFWIIVTEPSAE